MEPDTVMRRHRGATHALLLVLLALCLLPAASAADDERKLTPVWSLDVTSSGPVVTRNKLYRHRRAFPLPTVFVTDIDHPVPPISIPEDNGSVRHYFGGVTRLAVLPVSRDGLVTAPLEYLPLRQVVRASPSRIELVNLGKNVAKRSVPGVALVDPLRIAGVEESDLVLWTTPWNPAPHHDAGILLTKGATTLIAGGNVKLRMHKPGYAPAFADSADVGAVCLFDSIPTFRGAPSRLVVFDFEGRTICTVPFPTGHGCSNLYVSNSGRWVMALQQGDKPTILAEHMLLVDVATGSVRELPGIAGGYRHFSADERYMVEVRSRVGGILLFDITRPDAPRLVSKYDSGDEILSTAINADGTLIAAVLTNPWRFSKIAVFNRNLDVVATVTVPTNVLALTIASNMLFVGLPTWELSNILVFPSQHIDLYDLHSFR